MKRLNGKSAVEIVIHQGCTDVILTDIGDGALGHLQAAHIRAWAAPGPVAGDEALRMFGEGQLTACAYCAGGNETWRGSWVLLRETEWF